MISMFPMALMAPMAPMTLVAPMIPMVLMIVMAPSAPMTLMAPNDSHGLGFEAKRNSHAEGKRPGLLH